jgi:phosphomannomutase
VVPADLVTAVMAKYFLRKFPKAAIVYNVPSSWAVKDWVSKLGGRPYIQKTGHAFMKQKARAVEAVFGGEHSAHYYFKDTFYAENDLLPVLTMLAILSQEQKPLSLLVKELGDYHLSGELNFEVEDKDQVIRQLKEVYKDAERTSFLDGISLDFSDWHFNVRPSANDPVMRLNVETKIEDELEQRVHEVSQYIGGKNVS